MRRKFRVEVNGKEYIVEIEEISSAKGVKKHIPPKTQKKEVKEGEKEVEGAVTAPMSGKVLSLKVKVGESVKEGDLLLVLEAMKMENEILAPKSGIVKEIKVNEGDIVDGGDILLIIS